MIKNRVALWDNIKFFLITLVVIGHLADEFTGQSDFYKSIFLFIYSFHMPLFIFISGLFHSEKNIVQKCIFYVSIGFLYKILSVVIDRLQGNVNVSFSLLSDGGISWFMFVLAIYTIIFYILKNQNKKYILVFSIMLACFVGYDKSINDFLYLSRTIIFFPFYLLGTMIKSKEIIEFKEKNKYLLFAGVFIILLWLVLCFVNLNEVYKLRYLFTGRNPFYPEIIKYGPVIRLFCYFISTLLCFSFIVCIPSKEIRFISKMGKNSINVYFWHWKLYLLLYSYLNISNLFFVGRFGKIIFLLIGILISVILSQDIFSFPMKQVKKYINKINTI
ncbi:MAG: acyltransferase family protein [Peptoniphilaceae bacterium]|uniref:acyltransferase family protein n=1 Tax=Parvimonas sp. TaxID=1944660 RepID=UPI0025D242E0|nr:acyltransferase family protein [Parvimonas sp.]MCI5997101.1 acyltransferase family protein [Parvimonas sp.]MDD7765369.1 acyltransferase family protein [Peptoniphilaceae bacterium]MDY3050207.1 acyltransferase family protein [Parvimonas sp.]